MIPVNIPNIKSIPAGNNQEEDAQYLRINVRAVYKKVLKDKYSLKLEKYSKIIFDHSIRGYIIYGRPPDGVVIVNVKGYEIAGWLKLFQAAVIEDK